MFLITKKLFYLLFATVFICNEGCGRYADTGDLNWSISVSNGSVRHSNGLNNALISPHGSSIRIYYKACNTCGCSATKYQDFDVVGDPETRRPPSPSPRGGSRRTLSPNGSGNGVLVPVGDGGISGQGNNNNQFAPTKGNN